MSIRSSTESPQEASLSIAAARGQRPFATPTGPDPGDQERQRRVILTALPSWTGRTLEMNADEGELGLSLAARATTLVRLEPDRARRRRLAARGHARVRAGGIASRLPMRHYDTIVCVGLLDGVPHRDVPLVRQRLVHRLAAGGLLVLQHGQGADAHHPPFLDHGLETLSLEVLGGVETLVLRRRRARSLADAGQLLADLIREPWPAPTPPSHWGSAEADLETGRVVGWQGAERANGAVPRGHRLLLRVADRPATMVTAAGPTPSRDRVATELAPRVAHDLVGRLRRGPRDGQDLAGAFGPRPLPRHPLSSAPRRLEPGELVVAVCTARGPDESADLIRELATTFDVIVHENGTDEPRLAGLCGTAGVIHHHDPRPGAAAARNRVLAGTDAPWVLFLDDDCRLGPGGGPELARRLGGAIDRVPDAGTIGGLVLPLSLDSAAQDAFERIAGHGRGFLPTRYDAHSWPDRWWPLRHGDWMAVGACLAVRREAWKAVGGFDERLGPGRPAASAEDDAFLRAIVEGGWSVFYDPGIVVRHKHRGSQWALRRQLFGYGLGRSVHVLLRTLDTRDRRVLLLWAALLAETAHEERARPLDVGGAELLGYLTGPIVALKTARRSRRSDGI